MTFPVFRAMTVHFVLRGSGLLRVGEAAPLAFAPSSVLIIPALKGHWIGDATGAQVSHAGDQCAMIGDGLVEFTAGDGSDDTWLLCGAVSGPHQAALGLFDLLQAPLADGIPSSGLSPALFEAMRQELASAGLGAQAMCQALMKQGLISLLRAHWSRDDSGALLAGALHHPRLARAIVAIIERPAATHTVDSLASLAGMSRASFSDHFSRAFDQGPIEFVQKARLRIAARLLRDTDLPIKVIAQSVGYAGSRPFSRAFAASYSRGPRNYRAGADVRSMVASADGFAAEGV